MLEIAGVTSSRTWVKPIRPAAATVASGKRRRNTISRGSRTATAKWTPSRQPLFPLPFSGSTPTKSTIAAQTESITMG